MFTPGFALALIVAALSATVSLLVYRRVCRQTLAIGESAQAAQHEAWLFAFVAFFIALAINACLAFYLWLYVIPKSTSSSEQSLWLAFSGLY